MSRRSRFLSLGLAVSVLAFTLFLPANLFAQSSEFHEYANAQPNLSAVTFTESEVDGFTGNAGAYPGGVPYYSNLVQASDGNFYGTTLQGGANGDGVVFKVTPAGAYTELHAFAGGATDGLNPYAGLVQGTDGNFYGMTYYGGVGNDGTVFKISSGGTFTLLHSFAGGSTDGENPYGGLVQGTDGNFYGATTNGGAQNLGTFFQITPAGTLTLLHSFTGSTTDGALPQAAPVEGADGNFYGTAIGGGVGDNGMVYKISSNGTFKLIASATVASGANSPGALVQGADGNFYGTASVGGTGNTSAGTIFKVTASGTLTALHTFNFNNGNTGFAPNGSLVLSTDGNFYGTTAQGGATNHGVVFQITPAGVYTLLYTFTDGTTDGGLPYSGLVQGNDGNFYGMTSDGGSGSGAGAIYKITVSPAFSAPVQLSASSPSVTAGQSFTMSYSVLNSYAGNVPGTLNQCFATNNAGDATGWTGILDATPTTATKELTAPSATGTYNYTLTCGGMESNVVTVTVTPPPSVITFSSVGHNFGSSTVGTAATAYTLKVTNSGSVAYPFSLVFTPANGFTSATNCPASIAAGANCELAFYFTPSATGTVTANWSLTPEGSFSYTPSNGGTLTGTGSAAAGAITLTTAGHNFGTQMDGTTSATYGTELKNSTSTTQTLMLGSLSGTEFTSLTNCGATLASGASCELEFTFNPTTPGITQKVFTLSSSPTAITVGGAPLPNGGITLTGTGH